MSGDTPSITGGRLVNDAVDVSLFDIDHPVGDVIIEATAASTEIASFGTDDLRQIMLVARTSASGGGYAAAGCGIEVVEGTDPTQKTSVISYSGTAAAVTTTPVQRVNRAPVEANEEFRMRMELDGSQMTCTVTLDGTDTTVAQGSVAAGEGEVGFHVRETRALFKNVRVCELP